MEKYSKSKQTKYSGFIKLGVRWAEQDIQMEKSLLSCHVVTVKMISSWLSFKKKNTFQCVPETFALMTVISKWNISDCQFPHNGITDFFKSLFLNDDYIL